MTDTELNVLESAAKAATPGPWMTDGFDVQTDKEGDDDDDDCICSCNSGPALDEFLEDEQEANAAFIAAANPATILDLIAELRQAKAERDWLAAVLSDACKSNSSCPFTFWACIIEGDNCLETRLTNWLQAAKEATCLKTSLKKKSGA